MISITQIWCGTNYPKPIKGAKIVKIQRKGLLPTVASDYRRFEMAAKDKAFVYADFDVVPKRGLLTFLRKLPAGKPFFAFYQGQPEPCLFAVNGCCDFFKELLEEKKKRGIGDIYSWTRKVLRDKDVFEIPADLYIHKHNTLKGENNGSKARKG